MPTRPPGRSSHVKQAEHLAILLQFELRIGRDDDTGRVTNRTGPGAGNRITGIGCSDLNLAGLLRRRDLLVRVLLLPGREILLVLREPLGVRLAGLQKRSQAVGRRVGDAQVEEDAGERRLLVRRFLLAGRHERESTAQRAPFPGHQDRAGDAASRGHGHVREIAVEQIGRRRIERQGPRRWPAQELSPVVDRVGTHAEMRPCVDEPGNHHALVMNLSRAGRDRGPAPERLDAAVLDHDATVLDHVPTQGMDAARDDDGRSVIVLLRTSLVDRLSRHQRRDRPRGRNPGEQVEHEQVGLMARLDAAVAGSDTQHRCGITRNAAQHVRHAEVVLGHLERKPEHVLERVRRTRHERARNARRLQKAGRLLGGSTVLCSEGMRRRMRRPGPRAHLEHHARLSGRDVADHFPGLAASLDDEGHLQFRREFDRAHDLGCGVRPHAQGRRTIEDAREASQVGLVGRARHARLAAAAGFLEQAAQAHERPCLGLRKLGSRGLDPILVLIGRNRR